MRPTLTDGAFAEIVALLVETAGGSTPTVSVLNGPLGAGRTVGASTVMVGVVTGSEGAFTVTVGVATGTETEGALSASGNDRAGEVCAPQASTHAKPTVKIAFAADLLGRAIRNSSNIRLLQV